MGATRKTIAVTCRTSTERLYVILVLIMDPSIILALSAARPLSEQK